MSHAHASPSPAGVTRGCASAPARVATYAYVNLVVAPLLGWAVGGEALALSALAPALAVLAGVVVIVTARRRG